MDIADPAVAYEQLKRETAAMLNLDVTSSSLLENLQVDLVSLLRLQIDDLQGQVLDGKQVNLDRLSTALTMLRQLLPEKALVSSPPPAETRFGPSHRERLQALIENALRGNEVEDDEAMRDIYEREEMAAIAASQVDYKPSEREANPNCVGGRAQSVGELPAPSSPSAAPADAAPMPAPKPQRVETDLERMARVNAEPSNPPDNRSEPWRGYTHIFL
jgi:hypothetical protein